MSTLLRQPQSGSMSPGNGSVSANSGTKRKRDAGPKFYAVRYGNSPGIYHSWADCLEQVKGFKNASFKSFPSLTDAESFLEHGLSKDTPSKSPSKYYGIQNGRVKGVYTDWDTAKAQIQGWQKPKYKSFGTRAEAEAFVRDGDPNSSFTFKEEDGLEGKARPSASKKQKKMPANTAPEDGEVDASIEAGTGLLPAGSEDGFDSRIILNEESGEINYKNDAQRSATKMHAVGLAEGGMIHIYTDGACPANGSPQAIAGVGVYFGPQDPRNLSEALIGPRQTNQRAELTAIQRAIEIAPRNRDITIFSDSNYAIKCVTEWFVNWRKNGWKSSNKEEVKNKDLVEVIVNKLEERTQLKVQTKFQWVKGHANDPGNIAADDLATTGARAAREAGVLSGLDIE